MAASEDVTDSEREGDETEDENLHSYLTEDDFAMTPEHADMSRRVSDEHGLPSPAHILNNHVNGHYFPYIPASPGNSENGDHLHSAVMAGRAIREILDVVMDAGADCSAWLGDGRFSRPKT